MRATSRALAAATAVVAAAGVVGFVGCAGEPSLAELAKQKVVVTKYDPNADFAAFETYAIADFIPLVSNEDAGAAGDGGFTSTLVEPSLADPILDAVTDELTGRGYRRVGRGQGPDLGVAVTAVVQVRAVSFYGFWWGAGGAAGGYWGYPGIPFTTAFAPAGIALWRYGAIVIELYDLGAARAQLGPVVQEHRAAELAPAAAVLPTNTEIPVVWAAIIYAIIGDLTARVETPPVAEVHQAFAQSPYLEARRTP